MKTFDEYKDGDWVVYRKPGSDWHLMSFQAYKSKYTHNAFRLKYGSREVVADISEIEPISETNRLMRENYEDTYRDLPRSTQQRDSQEEENIFTSFQD